MKVLFIQQFQPLVNISILATTVLASVLSSSYHSNIQYNPLAFISLEHLINNYKNILLVESSTSLCRQGEGVGAYISDALAPLECEEPRLRLLNLK